MGARWAWHGVVVALAGCGPIAGPPVDDEGSEATGFDDAADDGATGPMPIDPATSTTGEDVCTSSCECEPSGAVLWRRTYRAPDGERVVGRSLARLPDGRMVVTGAHVAYPPEDPVYGDESLWVGVFDADATHRASALAFTSPVNSSLHGGFGVAVDGSRIAAAGTLSNDGAPSGAVVVFDHELRPLWSVRDEAEASSDWIGVALESDGAVVVTGAAYRPEQDTVAIVRRFAADGAASWSHESSGTGSDPYFANNRGRAVAIGSEVAWVAGTIFNAHDYGEDDVWLSAWQADGTMSMEMVYDSRSELQTYAGMGWDHGYAVAVAPDDAVLIVGTHYVEKPKDIGAYSAGERWARMFEPDGAERWSWWHDEPGVFPGAAHAVAFDACGHAFVVGEEAEGFDGETHMFVAKLAPSGELLWDVGDQPTSSQPGAYGVVADDDGSVVVLTDEGEDTIALTRFAP